MKLKHIIPLCAMLAILFIGATGSAFAFSFGPPDERTGAPNETTCAMAGCHAGNELNATGGSLMLTIPETYMPNEVYTIIVDLARAGQSRWGFEMTAVDESGAKAGSFELADEANTLLTEAANGKQYVKHNTLGTAKGTADENQWTVQWTAPDADIGPITFYAAGNAANDDGGATGDYIYTTSDESTPPIPTVAGVSLEADSMAQATMDASAGVTYTLAVKNTGNMTDTLTLTVSPEVGVPGSVIGALSQKSVELDADASADVILTVSGDAQTAPGDYVVTVTVTSGTDATKTAEVTTTTTIEIPPMPEFPAWDVNEDGTVDIRDLVLVAGQFGRSGEDLVGDVNGDGTVNVLDLVAVSAHFGEATAEQAQ